MPSDPERWKHRQKNLQGLLTWAFATVTVLAGMTISWLITPAPLSTAAGTGGTGGTGGSVVSLAFVNSSGDPLPELILSNDGLTSEIFVSADGMSVGVHDTVQLLLRHDPALTEVVAIGCSGVFGGAFSPPGPVAIAAGEVAFECGLAERVDVADGIVAKLTLRRVSAGVDALELVPDGPLGVRLFSSGVPSQAQPGSALSIIDPPPAETAIPAATATASPTPATGGGTPSGVGGGFFAPQPSPTAAFFPPGVPRDLDVTVGNGWADLTWLPPTSDGGAGITQYVVWSAGGAVNRQVPGDSLSARLTGLENGREYRFRVRAINGIGAGPLTEPSALVIPAGPPSAPLALIGVPVPSETGVRLSWSPPELLNGAEIESYTITE